MMEAQKAPQKAEMPLSPRRDGVVVHDRAAYRQEQQLRQRICAPLALLAFIAAVRELVSGRVLAEVPTRSHTTLAIPAVLPYIRQAELRGA